MSISGPDIKIPVASAGDVDLSLYVKKTGARMTGRINMGDKKITNLLDPTEEQDAATERYVSNFASHLNNIKLDKAGGTLTDEISMGNNKITNVGNPTESADVATKEYVDDEIIRKWNEIELKSIGRYILFPSIDGSKNTYFSVRKDKNIDFSRGRIVTIEYDQSSDDLNVNYNQLVIQIDLYTTRHRNPDENLGTFSLTNAMQIRFRAPRSAPWTLIFSAKPGNPNENQKRRTMLDFDQNKTLKFEWNETSFTYKIKQNQQILDKETVEINANKFHHFAFAYANRKFAFYLNGEKLKEHDAPSFNRLITIILGFAEMGLLHFYDKNLGKIEIAEHFIDLHLDNFTDNSKVLI